MYDIKVMAKLDNIIHQTKPKNIFGGIKKNKKILRRLNLMEWPDGHNLMVQPNQHKMVNLVR